MEPPFERLFHDRNSLNVYPLALGYLAGTIRRHTNWTVVAYNADYHPLSRWLSLAYLVGPGYEQYLRYLRDTSAPVWVEVKRTLEEHRPTVLGISTKSQNFASALTAARLAKEIDPRTVVVLGGPHPSMALADCMRRPEVDICVRGEGEATIVELLEALAQGAPLNGIRGISYRENGGIVENPPRPLIEDLDDLPFPHESAEGVLRDYGSYAPAAFSHVFATRGCPDACTFCGSREIWSRRVRFRSPANVAEEIQRLRVRGVGSIHFDDDTFGVKSGYLRELCDALATTGPGLKWSCEIHARLATDENIAAMKVAGCHQIDLGMESGSDEILEQVRKNITAEQALAAALTIRRHGIRLRAFFMVGFPQETEQTLAQTCQLMKRTPADRLIYSIFTPYPGTAIFAQCKEWGLIDEEYDVSLYSHKSPANHF
jgi:radical SAM superfamily enzyme YgiQ (UPF0313 family)